MNYYELRLNALTEIIVEFILKTQCLAYSTGRCRFCGGGRQFDEDFPASWKPRHHSDCLYTRAERLVDSVRDSRMEETDE